VGPAAASQPAAAQEAGALSLPPAPATYASWLDLLDRFEQGDDEALRALEAGTLVWSAGVAQRWTERVHEALAGRLSSLSTRLQRDLDRAAGDLHAVARALAEARRGLGPLARFSALPAMPAEVRAHLRRELELWVERTQGSLEKQAARVRADQGLLQSTLRGCRLDLPAASSTASSPMPDPEPPGKPAVPGEPAAAGARARRMILEG
jgi:hypothetical protein